MFPQSSENYLSQLDKLRLPEVYTGLKFGFLNLAVTVLA